jgi:trans-aconitate methyltransferase
METSGDRTQRHPIVEEYGRLASHYDAKWSFYVEATTRETLARLTLRPGERLLDVGCVTGALLHPLSQRYPGARLTGVDPAPEMLAITSTTCYGLGSWKAIVPNARS